MIADRPAVGRSPGIVRARRHRRRSTRSSVASWLAGVPRTRSDGCSAGCRLSLALWMFGHAYAQAGLGGRPGLGSLPGAAAAAWVGAPQLGRGPARALPTFLLIFPDGHLRSRRWRIALAGRDPRRRAHGPRRGRARSRSTTGRRPLDPPGWAAELPGIRRSVRRRARPRGGSERSPAWRALVLRFRSADPRGASVAPTARRDDRGDGDRHHDRARDRARIARGGVVMDRDRAGGPRRRVRGPDRDPGRDRRRRPHVRPVRRRRRDEEDRRVRRAGDLLRAPVGPPQPPALTVGVPRVVGRRPQPSESSSSPGSRPRWR